MANIMLLERAIMYNCGLIEVDMDMVWYGMVWVVWYKPKLIVRAHD